MRTLNTTYFLSILLFFFKLKLNYLTKQFKILIRFLFEILNGSFINDIALIPCLFMFSFILLVRDKKKSFILLVMIVVEFIIFKDTIIMANIYRLIRQVFNQKDYYKFINIRVIKKTTRKLFSVSTS